MVMGATPKDEDFVVVGATPADMEALGFEKVGADFPVYLHPDTGDEYALARQERKSGNGYHGFSVEFGPEITLEQDLERRDLTMNAMAMDDDGGIFDPFNGRQDIENGVLRHVNAEAFIEDPVRVLRLARFAARYSSFVVHEETVELVYQIGRKGELSHLTPERVFSELRRALMEPAPRRFFDTLRNCDVLHRVFPEVFNLLRAPEYMRHHPEGNAYEHTMLVLTAMKQIEGHDEIDMFNALCHDFGKALTAVDILPSHLQHEKTGVPVVRDFLERLKAPRKIVEMAKVATRMHMRMHILDQMQPKSICKMFDEGHKEGRNFAERMVRMGKADERGRLGNENANVDHLDKFLDLSEAHQAVRFADVKDEAAGLSGEQIGELLYRARIRAIADRRREIREETRAPKL